jgi:cellulose synthase/poly-beta-1,6-N-acetylglucosamine synthase-like glycosyltransferase
MATYLGNRITAHGWMPQQALDDGSYQLGVLVRGSSRGSYVTCPARISDTLLLAVQRLNVGVAIAMRPNMLPGLIAGLRPDQHEIHMPGDRTQLQILPGLVAVTATGTKKFQWAAILKKENMLLVLQDNARDILDHAQRVEDRLLAYIWESPVSPMMPVLGAKKPDKSGPSAWLPQALKSPKSPDAAFLGEIAHSNIRDLNINHMLIGPQTQQLDAYEKLTFNGTGASKVTKKETPPDSDLEKNGSFLRAIGAESINRPFVLYSAIFMGAGLALNLLTIVGVAVGELVSESLIDGYWPRIALLAVTPLLFAVAQSFFQVIFSNLWAILGPIGGITHNTRTHSCEKPDLRLAYSLGLAPPHITIQMPVYKEGMETVIIPTVRSLQDAISFYESHGGSASILINEDGMRAGISDAEAQKRKDFYHDNNIGWVSRPKHGADGFQRRGKFKKASNMNFALNLLQQVEEQMQQEVAARCARSPRGPTDHLDEDPLLIRDYELEDICAECLSNVLEANPIAMAEGNIRVGEIILIVDSDTRVPADCLLYGAAEMFLSPEVAILQHSTGVMQVSWDYFENGITFFTNLIYTAIRFAVGSGETGPFVGHNAFLRWSAIQDVGRADGAPDGHGKTDTGYVAYWSESHVSEDFDISLRLQVAGSIVRLASYHDLEFKEGVSLGIYDELARWQKYAYGCSEMVFHPLYQWPWKGPFAPLFRKFCTSGQMQLSSRISVFGYICSCESPVNQLEAQHRRLCFTD